MTVNRSSLPQFSGILSLQIIHMALVVYQGAYDALRCDERGESKYVGLANQGATCYLNSLLQTLFMTPEFRRAIFSWHYNPDKDVEKENCIPFQLQRLFGLLQLSKSKATDTVALTNSFGWGGSEVFQQQDVQELTRVLFDALEDTFKGTEVENIIDQLYAGELIDYIRCIDVAYQSERTDKFLDLSFAIVPFGSSKAMHSLSECIQLFLRPELLDGENQYFAESVGRKVDAIKGLKFGKLPPIMICSLKRFVYDFSSNGIQQKKMNDIVRFPFILDMNKYVSKHRLGNGDAATTPKEQGQNITIDEFEVFLQEQMQELRMAQSQGHGGGGGAGAGAAAAAADIDSEDSSLPDLVDYQGNVSKNQEVETERLNIEKKVWSRDQIDSLVRERGEWVYELYAVLIHSGAIAGGHYYAYIKDLDTNKWYNFNDSHVSPIDESEVQDAWGGSSSYSSNHYGKVTVTTTMNCANAYMLMYRKVSFSNGISPVSFPDDSMVPEYVREEVRCMDEEVLEKERLEDQRRNRLDVKVYWKEVEYTIKTSRKATYIQLLTEVWQQLDLEHDLYFVTPGPLQPSQVSEGASALDFALSAAPGDKVSMRVKNFPHGENHNHGEQQHSAVGVVPLTRLRLRKFNIHAKVGTDPFDLCIHGTWTLAKLLPHAYGSLLLEARVSEEEEWEPYFADGLTLRITEFCDKRQATLPARMVHFSKGATTADLEDRISQWISYPKEELLIIKCTPIQNIDAKMEVICGAYGKPLPLKEGFILTEFSSVLFERKVGSEPPSPNNSKAFAAFVSSRCKYTFKFNAPPEEAFTETIEVDARWEVGRLREAIATRLSLSADEIRMNKLYFKGLELKDDTAKLTNAGLYNNFAIAVSVGKALPVGFFQVECWLHVPVDMTLGVSKLPVVVTAMPSKVGDMRTILGDTDVGSKEFQLEFTEIEYESDSLTNTDRDMHKALAMNLADPLPQFQQKLSTYPTECDLELVPLTDSEKANVHVGSVATTVVGDDVWATGDDDHNSGYNNNSDIRAAFLANIAAIVVNENSSLVNGKESASVAGPLYSITTADPVHALAVESASVAAHSYLEPNILDMTLEPPPLVPVGFKLESTKVETDGTGTSFEANDFAERQVGLKFECKIITGLDLVVSDNTQMHEMRQQVTDHLVTIGLLPEGASPKRVRLRDRVAQKADKILRDGHTLGQSSVRLSDMKTFCVQVLDTDEDLDEEQKGDIIIPIRRWHRSTWSLGEAKEVCLKGNLTVADTSRRLAKLFDIAEDSLLALIVFSYTDVMLCYLHNEYPKSSNRAWFQPGKEKRALMRDMFYLNHDDMLLLQDSSEPLRQLTEPERLSVQLVEAASNYYSYSNLPSHSYSNTQYSSSSSIATYTSNSAQTGGIKIKVQKHSSGELGGGEAHQGTTGTLAAEREASLALFSDCA